MIQSYELGTPLYIQFCPMADGDKGAFWVNDTSLIENPYYGDVMLRCGFVEGEI